MTDFRPPRNAKESAVRNFKSAVRELPEDSDLRDHLELLDIHDPADRMEIEEIIEHEVADDHYHALHDSWHEVRQEFDY